MSAATTVAAAASTSVGSAALNIAIFASFVVVTLVIVIKVASGRKLAVTATVRASSVARSQWRERSSAAGPLTPKCVHSMSPVMRRAIRPSTASARRTGSETPDRRR